MTTDLDRIIAGLSEAQRKLLIDLCECPGLFAGQYRWEGWGIEQLPYDLWRCSYKGAAYALIGLGHAYPSDTGLAVRQRLQEMNDGS